MKLLTRKKQNQILKLVAANQIIIEDLLKHVAENYEGIADCEMLMSNGADIAFLADGMQGIKTSYWNAHPNETLAFTEYEDGTSDCKLVDISKVKRRKK